MVKRNLKWTKTVTAAMTAALVLQSGFAGTMGVVAAEEEELKNLYELTAPELETEDGGAAYARLKINGALDYGDYGIERQDIPGVSYVFSLTTKDEEENVIDDDQVAYCIQSYFLTPLSGDHSSEMTDQVSAVGGERNLHKVIYYGYGGAGYDAAEFEAFLAAANAEYYENVYQQLSEKKRGNLAYILTHSAASYAYFNDGTDFEKYLELQFEVKYGENWEKELGYFTGPELKKAGITDDDMNLFGSTYGMTATGIELVKAWYELLTGKDDPGLSVTVSDEIFTFEGNEKNEELKLEFTVPENFACDIIRAGGETEQAQELQTVSVSPGDEFSFTYVDDLVSAEEEGISELNLAVDGTLSGTENEVWNLVILETNKGTNRTVDKRQQDIAAASMVDAGRTELDFEIALEKGSISIQVVDEVQQAVSDAVFGVYYDEDCSTAVTQDGEAVQLLTNEQGEAYLEFVLNQTLKENGGKLYVKELSVPEGNALDETVFCVDVDGTAEVVNVRVFGEAEVPLSVQVNLTGRSLKEGEFSFELIQVTDETGMEVLADAEVITASNDADGNVAFEGITVDDLGTYYYKITAVTDETEDSVEEGSFIAVVDVTADEANKGQLNVSVSYPEGQPEFEEVYEASGEVLLEGIQVALNNDALEAGEFTFELKDADGNVLQTAVNDAEGNVVFDAIAYSEADIGKEYVYTISQVTEENETVAFDAEDCTVTVKVEDSENSDGTLKITQEMSGESFENSRVFEAEEIPLGVQVNLTGRDLKEGEFTFEVVQVTDETGAEVLENGAVGTASNDADGNVAFEGISVSEQGTYYYKITAVTDETEDSVEEGSFIAVAEVTADETNKGQLNVSVSYPEGQPSFEEVYEAAGEAVLEGVQVVLGNDALEEGEFTFELKDAEGNVLQTAVNDADGNVTFDAIAYSEEDIGNEYIYTVSQVTEENGTAAFDAEDCTITVKVEDSENSDGTLNITQEVSGGIFENSRVFEAEEIPLEVQVNLTGRDLKEGEFSFEVVQVTDETGAEILENGAVGTASNDADGNVTFEGISVSEQGTYYYKITAVTDETEDSVEEGSFIAVVEVTADETNKGQLNVSVSYPEGQPSFEEAYEAAGEAVLEDIQVVLDNDVLEAGEFSFELKDAEGNVLQTAANDAEGNVTFDAIEYSEEDIGKEYIYTISQVDDGQEDITYDSEDYTVTIKVEDSEDSDGTLKITQETTGAVFRNVYVELETETETEAVTEAETEDATEAVTEAETEAATEAVTETETEAATEAVTETETEAVTEAVTETETETEAVTEAETEAETPAPAETESENGSGWVLPVSISTLLLLILLIIRWIRKKAGR